MRLIVGHEAADFDALAGAVAVARLHPDARIGLPRSIERGVRAFLSLHADRFPAVRCKNSVLADTTSLIVVDVRSRRRLSHVEPVLARRDAGEPIEIVVYDHHPRSDDDLAADVEVVSPVGAVTTLLVERLQTNGLAVDPVEATLYALGIHADTLSLTAGTTTPRDARALAWLIGEGARPDVVARYLSPPLTAPQRDILSRALATLFEVPVRGLHVALARVSSSVYVEGVAEVATELLRTSQADALFVLCAVGDRKVEIVGRSRSQAMDVGVVLAALGGGGHPGAGAARLRTGNIDEAEERLRSAMSVEQPRAGRVRDVMSRPVLTLSPELDAAEAHARLEQWSVTGAPVLAGGKVVGVVSRRDVSRPGDKHTVRAAMTSQPRTVSAEASLEEALRLMTEGNIGRLPVLEGEQLVGIVTRTDVLRFLYSPDRSALSVSATRGARA